MQSAATIKNHRPLTNVIWIVVTQVYAVLGAWAAFAGAQAARGFALVTVGLSMLVPLLLHLEWGLAALMVFEPLRGLLRRLQYLIVPYSDSEPIHLLSACVTLVAVMLVFRKLSLSMFLEHPLTKSVTLLGVICLVQMFNPLQGGVIWGFMGGLFYVLPMAWFYFGKAVDDDFFPRAVRLVPVMGLICSLWGVFQILNGYPWFEQYWIDHTDAYSSIAVYNVTRALATFSNAEEWGRYVLLGALCAFGLSTMRSLGQKRYLWLMSGFLLCLMLALSGQRSSIFGLLLGVVVLVATGARSFGKALGRVALVLMPLVLIVALSGSVSEDDLGEMDSDQGVSTMLNHAKKGTVDPASEGSLYARLRTWNRLVTETIPSNPFGSGLGLMAVSNARRGEAASGAVDNHFLTLAISAGLPAMLILIWILLGAARLGLRSWLSTDEGSDESTYWRIALALLSSFFLNNIFGTSFVMYSIAPIGWLLLGWIAMNGMRAGVAGRH